MYKVFHVKHFVVTMIVVTVMYRLRRTKSESWEFVRCVL
jgi:hypothetical protein